MIESASEPGPVRGMSAWKLAAIFATAAAILGFAYIFWINSTADRRFRDMDRQTHELLAGTLARNGRRPALRGPTLSGNAWDDYQLALAETRTIRPSGGLSLFADYLSQKPKADRVKVEEMVLAHLTALENLRRGASRSLRQYPYQWEKGFAADCPSLLDSQILVQLAACRARFLLEAGKPREAAELLLDACQFSGDLGYNGVLITEMISVALYSHAFDELRDLILSGKCPPELLSQIDRELEGIDQSFPDIGPAFQNEALMAGFSFLKTRDLTELLDKSASFRLESIKYGGSMRLMVVDAFETDCRLMKLMAEDRPWSEEVKVFRGIANEVVNHKNPVVRMMVPGTMQSGRAVHDRRVQLRLLRVAAHYRATGEILETGDPYGTKLRSSKTGDKLKVWSFGRDGIDHGGVGEWKSLGSGKDVVLDVER